MNIHHSQSHRCIYNQAMLSCFLIIFYGLFLIISATINIYMHNDKEVAIAPGHRLNGAHEWNISNRNTKKKKTKNMKRKQSHFRIWRRTTTIHDTNIHIQYSICWLACFLPSRWPYDSNISRDLCVMLCIAKWFYPAHNIGNTGSMHCFFFLSLQISFDFILSVLRARKLSFFSFIFQ